jgi:hypothetical protein
MAILFYCMEALVLLHQGAISRLSASTKYGWISHYQKSHLLYATFAYFFAASKHYTTVLNIPCLLQYA